MYFTSNDGFQNIFFYQPILHTLEIKKGTDYVLSWISKRIYNSKLKSLYPAFLHSIKFSAYRFGIKFDKDPLAVEQNAWLMLGLEILLKISNLRIAYLEQLI